MYYLVSIFSVLVLGKKPSLIESIKWNSTVALFAKLPGGHICHHAQFLAEL